MSRCMDGRLLVSVNNSSLADTDIGYGCYLAAQRHMPVYTCVSRYRVLELQVKYTAIRLVAMFSP